MKYKFDVGEKVLCFEPDESKARVLYNAKIMAADILKDPKGKKRVEYKIHFQGWNHAWDRWADETFVVKDDEQNRKLQRKLARKAIKKLRRQKGRKRHHLPGVASKQEGGDMMEEQCYSSDDSVGSNCSVTTNTEKKSEHDDDQMPMKKAAFGDMDSMEVESISSVRDELLSRRLVTLDIPASLRARLEEDFTMVKKRDMLLKLPIRPNVVQILDNYIKKFAQQYFNLIDKQKFGVSSTAQQNDQDVLIPAEKRLNLCQEVCCDVKLLFDFALPLTLLYVPERQQFKHLMRTVTFCKDMETRQELEIRNDSEVLQKNTDVVASEEDANGLLNSLSPLSTSTNQSSNVETSNANGQTATHKPQSRKKNAEAQLIEETHKYLIPNQPNLDQTGLSQDAQGRRRSSRLSHHENTPVKMNDPKTTLRNKHKIREESKILASNIESHKVSAKPHIFLRAPGKRTCPSSSHNEGLAGNCHHLLYNANPCMDWESYILSCGSDVKTIKELKKIWDWSILPDSYEHEEGALVPPSLIYGIHHLLRFFVKLPDIMVQMEIPEYKVRVIMKHLQGLLKFLGDYERELFEIDCYVPPDFVTS